MEAPDGIPGSVLTGPFPVGTYAAALRDRLRGFTRVQVFGEVFGFKAGRAKVWFELRDAAGALPCSMWREDFDKLRLETLADGAQVVVAGGCDYYPGSRTASPGFSFSVARLRVAGEGDLLAQLEQLRRKLHGEGLFAPQKALALPKLPRCIGVVTGESGKARDDVLAGLRRRGWAGRLVWGFAPVQDRHAAPAITRALQDLAACEEVDVIVVARGGGSLADLFAFCDETLCRTVALLRVPVISSVGHHTDRTLLDDVAAVACSTPTHAAETAVPFDCNAARSALTNTARRLEHQGRRAVLDRARTLARLSRAPSHHVARHRARLHQHLRELRAATRRAIALGERHTLAKAATLERKATAAASAGDVLERRTRTAAGALDRASATALERRRRELDRTLATLAAHDPQRTLERGYALVEDAEGEPVTSADAARTQPTLTLRLHDGRVTVRPEDSLAATPPPTTPAATAATPLPTTPAATAATPLPTTPAATAATPLPTTPAATAATPPSTTPPATAATPPPTTPPATAATPPPTTPPATAATPPPTTPPATAATPPPTTPPATAATPPPTTPPATAATPPPTTPPATAATPPPTTPPATAGTPPPASPATSTPATAATPAATSPPATAATPASTPPPPSAPATTPPPATAAARAAKRPPDDDAEPRLFGP